MGSDGRTASTAGQQLFWFGVIPLSFLSWAFLSSSFQKKELPNSEKSPQVQVIVSDKIAPVFWVMTQQMQGLLMSMHFTSSHACGGEVLLV